MIAQLTSARYHLSKVMSVILGNMCHPQKVWARGRQRHIGRCVRSECNAARRLFTCKAWNRSQCTSRENIHTKSVRQASIVARAAPLSFLVTCTKKTTAYRVCQTRCTCMLSIKWFPSHTCMQRAEKDQNFKDKRAMGISSEAARDSHCRSGQLPHIPQVPQLADLRTVHLAIDVTDSTFG